MTLYLPRGLPARQTRFLCLLAVRPSLTRADYQRLMAVSPNTAKREVAQLVAERLIVPFGTTRTRRYGLSPLALISPDLAPNVVGSPDHQRATVGVEVDQLSLSRR